MKPLQMLFSHCKCYSVITLSSQRTPLETVYNLKLSNFVGTEGPEGAERWLNHVEKTFRVMQGQGNHPKD